MNALLENLGIILVLLGVICLVVYALAVPSNALLVTAIALEFVGIIAYIVLNKRIKL